MTEVTVGMEQLNQHEVGRYPSEYANFVATAFLQRFHASLQPVNSAVFEGFSAVPVTTPELGALANSTVMLDIRASTDNLYLEGITGDPSRRGAMAVLIAGKLMNSGLQVPVGIRNIIHIPAGDELLQKWKFVLPRHDKDLGGGSYEDMVGKENGLFTGGWTFLFNKFKAVKDSLWGSKVKVNHRWPHAAIRGNFGIGNALTEATASTFEAIKSTPNYSLDTAVRIERFGVLASVMPEVVNGRKLFPLQNILGIDLREEKIEASKANMARILAAQPGKLSDFEQRLRLRYQTVFKNLGIDSTVCMQYMEQNFDITNLLGVGHPSSYRATINAQRLNLQTMPRFAHYISGGPLYIGSLREV